MVQQVRVQFNGQWIPLTYNPNTGEWEGQFTPETTSFHQPGGYYNITVEAANDTGASTSVDGATEEALRLYINEKSPPTLTLISPSEGYVTTNKPEIVFYAADESDGSGVNIESLVIMVDGEAVEGAQWQLVESDYRISYTPPQALSEGSHTIAIHIADNDGNIALLKLSYIVDTLPPALVVSAPRYRSVVDWPSIEVAGAALDATAPVTVKVAIEGKQYAQTTVQPPFGHFSWDVPLEVGGNHITITAMDGVGWQTSKELFVIRLVTDRNQQDLTALVKLLEKPSSAWSQEEKLLFLQAKDRGAYNYTDLNRVNLAAGHLAEKLGGFTLSFDEISPGRTQWGEDDFPTPELMAHYLANVKRLAQIAPIQTALPEDMAGLTLADANAIEAVLVEVDSFTLYLNNAFYAGEIYSGET